MFSAVLIAFLAQEPAPPKENVETALKPASENAYVVETGTRVPLALINSVSTKNAVPGDRIYLETTFPILVRGRIVIPPGSYVAGTVTAVKRAGRVKGRSEMMVKFDSLTLPNGATRDFRATIANLDGRAAETLNREEGTVKGEGNKSGDLNTVVGAAGAGTGIGALAGIGTNAGMGAAIGAGAGAAAGLIGVLLTRGPDAILAKGSSVEMVLDRNIGFEASELDFSNAPVQVRRFSDSGTGPLPSIKQQQGGATGWPGATRRPPIQ